MALSLIIFTEKKDCVSISTTKCLKKQKSNNFAQINKINVEERKRYRSINHSNC